MARRRKGVIALANEKVPFPLAAQWAGIEVPHDTYERGTKVYCPFGDVEHPDGGAEPAMRIYPDHGWCFAESRYFSVVSLLAETWELSRADAAAEALKRCGYVAPGYAEQFAAACRDPEPDQDALAQALTTWCSRFPDWQRRCTDDPAVARQLSRCLGLLPLVNTGADCRTWLDAAKQAMTRVLTPVN